MKASKKGIKGSYDATDDKNDGLLQSSRKLQNSNINPKGPRFERFCDTSDEPTILLKRNSTTGRYQILDEEDETGNGNGTNSAPENINGNRTRRKLSVQSSSPPSSPIFPWEMSPRWLQNEVEDPGDILRGRQCPCAPVSGVFCTDAAPLCKVYLKNAYREDMKIVCMSETQDNFLRYIIPLTVFLFCFFAYLCFCSPRGRYSTGYLKKLFCRWDEERYQQALNDELDNIISRVWQRREAARRNQLRARGQRVFIPGNAPSISSDARFNRATHQADHSDAAIELTNRPLSAHAGVGRRSVVVLKTQRYQMEDNGVDAFAESEQCAICLSDFEAGDRVGDLRCGHTFHVDCLKTWIQRKNYCPLCKAQDVAQPQEDTEEPVSRSNHTVDFESDTSA